jgi:hypothetical protein
LELCALESRYEENQEKEWADKHDKKKVIKFETFLLKNIQSIFTCDDLIHPPIRTQILALSRTIYLSVFKVDSSTFNFCFTHMCVSVGVWV